MNKPEVTFRTIPGPEDPARVREIVTSTGFFREDEIEVAVELVEERLADGEGDNIRSGDGKARPSPDSPGSRSNDSGFCPSR